MIKDINNGTYKSTKLPSSDNTTAFQIQVELDEIDTLIGRKVRYDVETAVERERIQILNASNKELESFVMKVCTCFGL